MTTSESKHLQSIFKQLPPEQQQTLLAFADFLQSRLVSKPAAPLQPKHLPRSPNESVIAAIKRLAQNYPMLDKAKMLNETSRLMTEHVLHGRESVEVIDELEAVFLQYYQEYLCENTT